MELLSGLAKYSLDTKENWELANPILPLNTLCFETDGLTVKLKIGNGISTWNATPYFNGQQPVLADLYTLGTVSRALLDDVSLGINEEKYISPALLLEHLRSKVGGDQLILSPGKNKYRFNDSEVYINNFVYPTLRPYGSPEPENGGRIPDIAFRMEHKGTVTVSFQSRKGAGSTAVRVCKNLVQLKEVITTSKSYKTYTSTVDVIPGDIIAVQAMIFGNLAFNGRIRQVRLLVA